MLLQAPIRCKKWLLVAASWGRSQATHHPCLINRRGSFGLRHRRTKGTIHQTEFSMQEGDHRCRDKSAHPEPEMMSLGRLLKVGCQWHSKSKLLDGAEQSLCIFPGTRERLRAAFHGNPRQLCGYCLQVAPGVGALCQTVGVSSCVRVGGCLSFQTPEPSAIR